MSGGREGIRQKLNILRRNICNDGGEDENEGVVDLHEKKMFPNISENVYIDIHLIA